MKYICLGLTDFLISTIIAISMNVIIYLWLFPLGNTLPFQFTFGQRTPSELYTDYILLVGFCILYGLLTINFIRNLCIRSFMSSTSKLLYTNNFSSALGVLLSICLVDAKWGEGEALFLAPFSISCIVLISSWFFVNTATIGKFIIITSWILPLIGVFIKGYAGLLLIGVLVFPVLYVLYYTVKFKIMLKSRIVRPPDCPGGVIDSSGSPSGGFPTGPLGGM